MQQYPELIVDDDGTAKEPVHTCACGQGTMVKRKGKFGQFLGCSTFPKCRHTVQLA